MRTTKASRVFEYNGLKMPDPAPALPVERVRSILAVTYPEIATAAFTGPQMRGGEVVYTIERAVGTKG